MNSSFLKKLLHSFIGKGLSVFLMLVFSIVCTRMYGVEAFGTFSYGLSIVTIGMIIAKSGFDNSLVFYIPKEGNKVIAISFVVNFIVSSLIILISLLFIEDTWVMLMLPIIWLFSMEQIFFGIFKAEESIFKYYLYYNIFSVGIRIILAAVLSIYISSPLGIIIALYVSLIFSNISLYTVQRKKFEKIHVNKEYLKYSFTLVLAAMMGVAIDRVDLIMLGSMTNMTNVGVYQIVVQITNLYLVLLLVFDTAFGPKISRLFTEGQHKELRLLYIKSTYTLAFVSLFITASILILGEYILSIFGEEFLKGKLALDFRAAGFFLKIFFGSVWMLLAMTGNTKYHIWTNLIGFLMNIALNYYLIPIHGINGAAFASFVSIGFVSVCGYLFVKKEFELKLFKVF